MGFFSYTTCHFKFYRFVSGGTYIGDLNFDVKFESVVAMYPMYGVSNPFSDTCYGHGNISLRVEGSLDLASRCLLVSLLLFS